MTPQIVATWISDLAPCDRSNGPRRAFGLPGSCLVAILAVACSEAPAEPPPPVFTVTDSAGVRMVVNSGRQWGEGEGWQVTAEPVATLGAMDFPVEQQFQNIVGATRLSNGTIVILERADFRLRAFNAAGDLLWTAGGVGDGPGEMRSYADTGPVLTKLKGDTIQVQNGRDRIRYSPGGEVIEHVKLDIARFRRWGPLYVQYCPFDVYFLHEDIVVCNKPRPERLPDPWTSYQTIMRTTWNLDGLDTLGVFLEESGFRDPTHGVAMRTPLAARGIFRVGGGPEPRLLYARNDNYRIEVWDIATSRLAMVVERRVPRRVRTNAEAEALVHTGDAGFYHPYVSVDMDAGHWAPIDSVSIAEALFLDDLGFMWVRRGPTALDGEHARVRVVAGHDDMEWTVPAHSGLHDVFRPDGVYLGTVKLPHNLRITEIGPDYILGVMRDEMDVQYVWMYGLDRVGGGSG